MAGAPHGVTPVVTAAATGAPRWSFVGGNVSFVDPTVCLAGGSLCVSPGGDAGVYLAAYGSTVTPSRVTRP